MDGQFKKIIMIVNGLEPGGVETFLKNLCIQLSTKKYSILMISLKKPGIISTEISAAKIDLLHLNINKFNFLLKIPLFIFSVLKFKPDIIHSHLFYSEIFGVIAKLFHRKSKFIISKYETGYWMRRFHFLLEKIHIYFSDYVICDSRSLIKILTDRKFQKSKMRVVYPVAFSKLENAKETSSILLNNSAFKILTVARFEKVKGQHILIQSASIVKDKIPNIQIIFAGDGAERKNAEELAKRLGVDSIIIFAGFRRDIYKLLNAADIIVLPSLNETSPVTIFEAMSEGKAIVASSLDSITEILEHKKNALLFPAGNTAALADEIYSLYCDKALRDSLAVRSKNDFQNFYNSELQLQKIIDIYES